VLEYLFMEANTLSMRDYYKIVKRRKWCLVLPFSIVCLCALLIAVILPSVYKSTSTILIEERDIPADFVMTTVTSYAEQRLQSIHQRIVSFSRLLDIVNRFSLYPELKNKWTSEKIIEKMRKSISLEPVSAAIVNRRTGMPTETTIAFTLSYEGKNPETVQRVANVLTSLFLEENLQARKKQATETSEFLEKEMEKVKDKLSRIETKMAAFKESHINELPDLLQINMQSLNNIENNVERLNEQLRSLKERESYLQTQLANLPAEFEDEQKDKVQLAALKSQLMHLQSRFSDQYPDVIKTKAEIADFERQIRKSSVRSADSGKFIEHSDSPAYITLAAQLSSIQANIESVGRQISELNESADMYRRRIANTPKVEETYRAIFVERNNTQAKYDDLMRKHMEAKVAQGLEKEQKGERFTLIDPARLPESPHKPNRIAIILMGFVLAIGSSVGWASIREFTDQSVWDSRKLSMATSFPVLASLPEIITIEERQSKRSKQYILITIIPLIILVGLMAFHFLVMDLNVLWVKLIRKLVF
jgi:polysaccharide chain length determinant protein (PEP-CTERM system associated)